MSPINPKPPPLTTTPAKKPAIKPTTIQDNIVILYSVSFGFDIFI
jgi:hypothetical protein